MVRRSKRTLFAVRNGFCCGVDEVGRGAIAGPVVSAAVILPRGYYPVGLDDSKKLSKTKREALYEIITKNCTFAIGSASNEEIDSMNIHNASLLAMKRSVENLSKQPSFVFVDGKFNLDIDIENKAVINGDALIDAISAASIIAKVYRDNYMREMHNCFPNYDFINNMGYPTKSHKIALKKYGPSEIHRLSFRGVL